VLQVLRTLRRLPHGADFVRAVGGVHLLWLLALGRHVPALAPGALGLVHDLVRRSPTAALDLYEAGGLVLLLRLLFANSAGAPEGEGAAADPAAAYDAHDGGRQGDLGNGGDGGNGGARDGGGDHGGTGGEGSGGATTDEDAQEREARLCAVRVVSALTSDSRHGAQIAAGLCELLTPRFRMVFEGKAQAFLTFFDADHTSGVAEKHSLRPESSTSSPEMAPREGLPDHCQDSELTPGGLQGTPNPSNGPGGVLHDFLRTSTPGQPNPSTPNTRQIDARRRASPIGGIGIP